MFVPREIREIFDSNKCLNETIREWTLQGAGFVWEMRTEAKAVGGVGSWKRSGIT